MSYSTKPTFVTWSQNGWDQARPHPAMKWMEAYTKAWDAKEITEENAAKYNTEDYTYTNPKGESFTGPVVGHKAALETYAPFSEHKHEPVGPLAVWDTDNGWFMVGQATLFGDLPVPGEPKSKADATGRKWDLAIPGRSIAERRRSNNHMLTRWQPCSNSSMPKINRV